SPGGKQDANSTVDLAHKQNAAWIMIDSYHFGAEYQRAIKTAKIHELFVDDFGQVSHYSADLVLNQDLTANTSLYANRSVHTRLLLGTRYTLLRAEFLRWRRWQREVPAIGHRVLVTLGGADQENVTFKVLHALANYPRIEIVAVVGGSNPHFDSLQSFV